MYDLKRQDGMKCKFCGREVLEEAIYCNYCGKKIKEENQPVNTIAPRENNSASCQPTNKQTTLDSNKPLFRLLWFVGLIITVIYCVDGFMGTNIIKSLNPYVKSEKSIRNIYDEDEVKEELQKYITAQKETLPIIINDSATMTDIELEGKNIVATAVLEGALPSDYTQQIIEEIKKQTLLSGVFDEKFGQLFREFGYGIIYSYVNEYDEALYKIHIYPHEL